MAQADYNVANQSGASFRADLNNQLAAIVSNNSGASEPSTTYAYQWWADTTTGKLKLRNAANSAWIEIVQLDGEWTNIALENGTAAAPPLYFKSSGTDTGFFSPGTDALGFSTGGTERARIDSSGRLGIGTASPSNALHVSAAGTVARLESSTSAAALRFANSSANDGYIKYETQNLTFYSAGTERARIDSSGRLLVGTSGSDGDFVFTARGGGGAVADGRIAIATSTTAPASGTAIGRIFFLDGAGNNAATIQCSSDGTWGSGDYPGRLVFSTTADGASSPTERMRIDSSGRLGIGTSSPSNALTVVDAGGTTGTVDIGPASAQARIYAASDGIRFGSVSNDVVIFRTNNTERCRLDTSGCINIGAGSSSTNTPGLLIRGSTTSASQTCFQVQNSSSTNIIYCKNDTSFHSDGAYNATTTAAANVFISGAAKFGRVTSSIKYKTDVETLQDSYADAILDIRPVWFRSLGSMDNPDWGFWGFIAEEVYAIDPRLTFLKTEEQTYDEDGQPTGSVSLDEPEVEGVQYDRFVPHLVNLIKRQRDQIEALEARVAALEGA